MKEFFRFFLSNVDIWELGSWWNVGEVMVIRNLMEIYINFCIEISCFKVYLLGDLGVCSDSLGVLWKYILYIVLFIVIICENIRCMMVFDRFFCLVE